MQTPKAKCKNYEDTKAKKTKRIKKKPKKSKKSKKTKKIKNIKKTKKTKTSKKTKKNNVSRLWPHPYKFLRVPKYCFFFFCLFWFFLVLSPCPWSCCWFSARGYLRAGNLREVVPPCQSRKLQNCMFPCCWLFYYMLQYRQHYSIGINP